MKKSSNYIKNSALLLFSTLLYLFLAEWGYRLIVKFQLRHEAFNYIMCPTVHIKYDEKYGEQPKPNDSCWMTIVANGRALDCVKIFEANSDGLDGKTTIAQYKKADHKVMVFGDSFSHWDLGGNTWPDLLQQNLNVNVSKTTAVLNYARGAYGVLQMLDLAADKINELHPDLVVIAVIGDDLSRARWWGSEVQKDGITRWMISTDKNNFSDLRHAADFALIVSDATKEWGTRLRANSLKPGDPVISRANLQYARLKKENDSVHKQVPLFSWGHSFLLAKIRTGDPFGIRHSWAGLPRTNMTDFSADQKAQDDINRIRASGIPVMLVYLPEMSEFKSHSIIDEPVKGQNQKLISSLQIMFKQHFHLLQNEYKGPLPAKIDLAPVDMHPNAEGLKLYADIISPMVEKVLAVNDGVKK
jgi:hypothetical protein